MPTALKKCCVARGDVDSAPEVTVTALHSPLKKLPRAGGDVDGAQDWDEFPVSPFAKTISLSTASRQSDWQSGSSSLEPPMGRPTSTQSLHSGDTGMRSRRSVTFGPVQVKDYVVQSKLDWNYYDDNEWDLLRRC
mmetsp:Transcript_31200/g.71224  ORF Transcript_31200/g.71224 Transcript_31200/m.71224 type:complete len:135 (+) Transcript_31200:107-511(+)